MNAKRWNIIVIVGTASVFLLLAAATVVIDPFLHYHAPLSFLEYPLKDERYVNDGIARHYQYDSIITGTSMSQNFKCSEFDALFGAQSVKIAYSGATYHELNEALRRAVSYQEKVRYVVCSLDGSRLIAPAWEDEYEGYPDYLYDENPFNDVNYLLNKEVATKTLAVLNYTRTGEVTPDRDAYGSWSQHKVFGAESVLSSFTLLPVSEREVALTEQDREMITENISENFLVTAKANPETEFYLFYPPYSICYWQALVRTKQLGAQLEAQEIAARLLMEAENVHVFDFSDRLDIIANLDNYTDTMHYGDWINSEILECINAGRQELTADTLKSYYNDIKRMYEEYEYSTY